MDHEEGMSHRYLFPPFLFAFFLGSFCLSDVDRCGNVS